MEFGVGIKFHGTFKIPWNSTEFPFWPGKVPWNCVWRFHGIPWNSMEFGYGIKFHGTFKEFHWTKLYLIWRHQNSMEFHGIFHGIPWNLCGIWNGALLIPWHPIELGNFVIWRPLVTCNSMEYPIKVQGNERGIDFSDNLKDPWNSMELSYILFGGTKVPWNSMEYSMEFHGTKWYFIWRHQSSMEFHGIFHGIQWNTCVILNGTFLIPWNSVSFNLATA